MSPKIAIAVLVVAVLLFAVALGSGLHGGFGSGKNPTAGPLGGLLGGVLIQPLDLRTVEASPGSCIVGQQVVVQPGGTCTLTVPKAGPATRRLTYGQGTMSVSFTPGDNSFPTQSTTIPQPTHTLDVVAAGGRVVISCQGPAQFCVLQGGD